MSGITDRPHLFPSDLTGLTVLDVGGYDGKAARYCLDRGAEKATVVDSEQWRKYGWNGPTREQGPTFVTMDILDWVEPADVVICSNVCYHVQNPWLFLAHLRELTIASLLLHTWIIEGDRDYWQIYTPGDGHKGSPTVVWRPMVPALGKLLVNVGFPDVAVLEQLGEHVSMLCR